MAEPEMSQSNSNNATGIQTSVSSGTAYNDASATSGQTHLPDAAPYFQRLCEHYQNWQTRYTPTDAEGKQKLLEKLSHPSGQWTSPFGFELMVQTPRREGKDAGTDEQREKVERFSVLEGIRKYAEEHVLLVGRPGSGKSTALAKLVLEEATQQQRIPVLVELRSWQGQGSIVALIQNALGQHGLMLTDGQLATLWQDDRLLLLFDGLNELSSEGARSQLTAFRRDHSKIPMIFTTRDLSLGGDFGIEKKLEMQPLTEAQMQAFVRSYIPEQAEQMLQQLKDRLRELGQTPLLLWMLCALFRDTGKIPENLGLVFRWFTQGYERDSFRNHKVAALKGDVHPLSDRRLWLKAMKHLAFSMMQGETPVDFRVVISRNEAEQALETLFAKESSPPEMARNCLDDLLKYHLLQPDTNNEIAFRHHLIQEYYAAEALFERLPGLSDAVLQQEYLNYLKWTEPMALMLSLVENEVQAVRVVKLALEVDLKLGARLAGEPKLASQKKTVNLIDNLKISDFLKVQLLDISRSEYTLLFLRRKLLSQDSTVREEAAITLGKIGTESTIDVLINSLTHQDSEIRQMAAYGLGEVSSERVRFALITKLEDEDPEVRWKAAYSLGRIAHESDMEALYRAFQRDRHPRVRAKAALAWGMVKNKSATASPIQFSSSDIDSLSQILSSDTDDTARKFAAEALGEIGGETAVDALFDALCVDSDGWVRYYAAESLGKIGGELAIDTLIRALQCNTDNLKSLIPESSNHSSQELDVPSYYFDQEPNNSYQGILSIIKALGNNHKNASATNELLNFLYKYFRSSFRIFYEFYFGSLKENTLKALRQIRCGSIIDQLNRNLCNHKSPEILKISAEALSEIGNEQCILHLIEAFNEGDEHTCWFAGRALVKIEHEAVLKTFYEASPNKELPDQKFWIATRGLGEIGSESAIEHLFNISNPRFRPSSESTLDTLLDALESPEPWTRWGAAYNIIKRNFRSLSPEVFQYIEEKFFNHFNEEEKEEEKNHIENHIWKSYAYLLSKANNEDIVSLLSSLLHEEDLYEAKEWYILRVLDALGRISTQNSIDALGLFLVSLPDKFQEAARRKPIVTKILRIFKKPINQPVQNYLIESLKKEENLDSQTSISIAEVLADIGDSKVVPFLWGLLSKHSKNTGIISTAIGTIQNRCKYYNYELYQNSSKQSAIAPQPHQEARSLARTLLILAANPTDQTRLRLDQEVREIEEGLRRSNHRDSFTSQSRWAVRPKDLRRALLDYSPQILHFCGHGEGEAGIVLENEQGTTQLVGTDAIANLIQLFADQGLECVILNACYSEIQASAIIQHIPYVIGMSNAILDTTALQFASGFYDALGGGLSYEKAFEMGKIAIATEGIPEAHLPILKQRY